MYHKGAQGVKYFFCLILSSSWYILSWLFNNNKNMTDIIGLDEAVGESDIAKKEWIVTQLVTEFSDDTEFLRKVNKITFGLISRD